MPELPEVEVVKKSLEKILTPERRIVRISWNRPDLRFPLPLAEFRRWKNVSITAIERRAKYLRLESKGGSLVCHLGMTGSFRLIPAGEERRTHDHVEFWLDDESVLVFEDPRRFGFFLAWPGDWSGVSREALGVEPLSNEWTPQYLWQRTRGKATPIKTFLMDQKQVVGIGNIYASEVLFRAGVRPSRRAGRVTRAEIERIVPLAREILEAAILSGGSTIRDFRGPEGRGGYQDAHQVYGREGEPCPRCAQTLRRSVHAGRSTFWCAKCQT